MKIQSAPALPLRDRLRETTTIAILDAAVEVIAESGLTAVSLQAIAERAGVAVGTLYNYFQDKQALIDALFARKREKLMAAIDAGTKEFARAPFLQQLDAFVRAVLAHFDDNRAFLRVTLEAEQARPAITKSSDGKSLPVMQWLHDRAERVVRVGVKEKKLRDDATELCAIVLVSVLRGVLIMKIDNAAPLAAETEKVVQLFLYGAVR